MSLEQQLMNFWPFLSELPFIKVRLLQFQNFYVNKISLQKTSEFSGETVYLRYSYKKWAYN